MEGKGIRLLGTATGEPILSNEEVREAQRLVTAELAAQVQARRDAEEELARLRAEIERLRGQG
jgi:hypothetical protein